MAWYNPQSVQEVKEMGDSPYAKGVMAYYGGVASGMTNAGANSSSLAALKGSSSGESWTPSKMNASNMEKEMKSWTWDDVQRASVNAREEMSGDDAAKAKAEIEGLIEEAKSQASAGLIPPDVFQKRMDAAQTQLDRFKDVDVTSDAYKKTKDRITADKVDTWKAKAVKIGKAAQMEAASIQATDPAKAQELLGVAAQMQKQLDQSVNMKPADFESYLTKQASALGAAPNITMSDIITADPSNFVQIGADPNQAANLGNIMKTSAANVAQTAVQWDKDSMAARDEARSTGQSVLQSLQARMEGPTTAETTSQQRALTEQAQKNIASQFASQRGQANPAMQREMLRQQANVAQNVAGQQNLATQQETQRRQEALAGIAGSQQSQQFTEATQPTLSVAQMNQQAALQQAQLQQQALSQSSSQTSQAILAQAQMEQQQKQLAAQQQYSGSTLTAEQQQQMWLQQMQMAQQQASQMASLQQEANKGNQAAALQLAQMQQSAGALQYTTQADQATQNAQFQQQASQQNASNTLQAQLANQAAQQQMMQMGYNAQQYNIGLTEQQNQFGAQQSQQNIQNQMAMQQFWQNQLAAQQSAQQANQQNNAQLQTGVAQTALEVQGQQAVEEQKAKASGMGSLIGAGGTMAAAYFSDKRSKENIKEMKQKDLNEFFNAIKAKEYDYKDERHGKGKHAGFLTQDIKKTKLGKQLISTHEGTGYDMVNATKLLGILTAQVAKLSKKKKEEE